MCVACCLCYSHSALLWLLISPLSLYTLPIVSLLMSRHFSFLLLSLYLILHIFSPFYYLQKLFHTHSSIFYIHTLCTNIIQGLLIFIFLQLLFTKSATVLSLRHCSRILFHWEITPDTGWRPGFPATLDSLPSKSLLTVIILDFQCSWTPLYQARVTFGALLWTTVYSASLITTTSYTNTIVSVQQTC